MTNSSRDNLVGGHGDGGAVEKVFALATLTF